MKEHTLTKKEAIKVLQEDSWKDTLYTFAKTPEDLEAVQRLENALEIAIKALQGLILGDVKIKKLSWRPKCGETYYSFGTINTIAILANPKLWKATKTTWFDWKTDYIRLSTGTVFRTEEEAEEALPELYKRFTGKEWEE